MSSFTSRRLFIGVIGFVMVFSLFLPAATAGTVFTDSSPASDLALLLQPVPNLNGCIDLGFGNPPTSATHTAGAEDCYTFTASSGDEIRVNVVITSGNFNADLEIIRPGGSSLCSTIFNELTCTLDAEGTHTVIVDGLGTGGYKLVVQRLNDPGECTEIDFGNPPTAETYGVGEQDCFTFPGAIDDEIRVSVVATSGDFNSDLEIIRPDGSSLCSTIFAELTCHLDASGRHTAIVDGLGTGGYKIVVQRLNNPGACPEIAFGNPPTTGSYASGEQDCFTFPGAADDEIRVSVVVTSGGFNPDLEIIRPDGISLCDTIFSELTCHLDASGTHRVIVDGLSTGGYKIVVQRLNDPVSCVELPFGNPPTAGTYGAGEQDCYTFAGDAGDQIRANVTVTSGTFNPDLEIIRPDGSSLCSTIFTELPCTLDASGTHTVIVDGLGTGGYNITLTCLSGVCREVPLRNRFTDDTPTLRWNRLTWAIGYRIQVDDTANFAAPVVFTTTTPPNVLFATTTPLDDGRYYWRVQGQRSNGSWGTWSQVDSFTIDAD